MMYFRWNNAWQSGLSVNERQQVLLHEQGHVAVAKVPHVAKGQAMGEIRDFSRGHPCPEPLTEGQCILDFRAAPKKDWDIATDYVVNSEVKS